MLRIIITAGAIAVVTPALADPVVPIARVQQICQSLTEIDMKRDCLQFLMNLAKAHEQILVRQVNCVFDERTRGQNTEQQAACAAFKEMQAMLPPFNSAR